jgi:hypothetical protein
LCAIRSVHVALTVLDQGHRACFGCGRARVGRNFSADMPVRCEPFALIYVSARPGHPDAPALTARFPSVHGTQAAPARPWPDPCWLAGWAGGLALSAEKALTM